MNRYYLVTDCPHFTITFNWPIVSHTLVEPIPIYRHIYDNSIRTEQTNNTKINSQTQKISPSESTMDMEYNLNQVLQVLRHSDLHFSAHETPYSLYISIRKQTKLRKPFTFEVWPFNDSVKA